jgi:hypothetical protein
MFLSFHVSFEIRVSGHLNTRTNLQEGFSLPNVSVGLPAFENQMGQAGSPEYAVWIPANYERE